MVTKLEEQIINRVAHTRERMGISRKQAALALGIEEQSYGNYERRRSAFAVDQLFALSRLLGRPVEYFLGLDTGLSDKEGELLTVYRNLPSDTLRDTALGMLRVLAQKKEG